MPWWPPPLTSPQLIEFSQSEHGNSKLFFVRFKEGAPQPVVTQEVTLNRNRLVFTDNDHEWVAAFRLEAVQDLTEQGESRAPTL